MIDLDQSVFEQRNTQGVEVPGCVKTASDLERYRTMFAAVRPAWIVELGTYRGVSACWMADMAGCNVVSIDTHPQVAAPELRHPRVAFIQGNSVDPTIVAVVAGMVGDASPVVVVCDSDHTANHVYAEMVAYAPLVTVGSYLVIEDGIVAWLPEQLAVYGNSSPLDAIERFLGERDDFEVDMELEDMLPTTQHPQGWLRRVR